MNHVAQFCLIGLLACTPGCYDKVFPPFMRNGLDTPIIVRTAYVDGVVHEDTWQPGMKVATGREGVDIFSITISAYGRTIYDLDKQDLARMKRSVHDERSVMWNVQRDGIRPLSDTQL